MRQIPRFCLVALLLLAISSGAPGRAGFNEHLNATPPPAQFDDPYFDFRNAHYSNAGLLSERDEVKLGMQLHREVTKKYNLTDAGLDRVDRLGQRCAHASLRPTLTYKFHVIQGRQINGFSIPGGHVYVTTALVRLANDNE
ncbi:MAG TPA: M48 family metalloprotease, partial [Pyrinomonadaceae bacterium]|nr:M48 family metalloprotease [Pyrinomonadaceae bacterium]